MLYNLSLKAISQLIWLENVFAIISKQPNEKREVFYYKRNIIKSILKAKKKNNYLKFFLQKLNSHK